MDIERFTSRDGTRIAAYRSGAGTPLILVHGTGAANPVDWPGVVPALAEHFTVYAVDRRGRRESGDADTYAIEREYEDVAAVIDAMGKPANLLGHSFGGVPALEAALLTPNIRKLVLYEGVPIAGTAVNPEGLIERLQALLNAGDQEAMLTTFYGEGPGLSPREIEQLRSSPAWPARLAAAHTVPRELRALERYDFNPHRFKDLHTKTLLLVGGDSPQFAREAAEAVDAALPDSRIAVLPRQQHIAMYVAPQLFVGKVLEFLVDEDVVNDS